jgi:hypothetical protein
VGSPRYTADGGILSRLERVPARFPPVQIVSTAGASMRGKRGAD